MQPHELVGGSSSKFWKAHGAGDFRFCARELPGGVPAAIHFDPGMPIGDATSVPARKPGELVLTRRDAQGRAQAVPWSHVDPLTASELLRDIQLLAAPRS